VSHLVKEPFTAISTAADANRSHLRRVWLVLNVCSLDAPIVAVLWQMLAQKCLHIDVELKVSAILAVSVWIIYLSDRLLDVSRSRSGALAPRHEFCRRHIGAFTRLAVVCLFACGWLSGRINPLIFRNGLILALAVICYFTAIHAGSASLRKLWPKELVVGTIFSLGTFLPAWTLDASARREIVLPAALFALLCALNCIIIEFCEWTSHRSAINFLPHRLTILVGARRLPATTLAAFASAACFVASPEQMQPFYACCLLSSASLLWLVSRGSRIPGELLPVFADLSLFTPVLALAVFAR
jgi:hypothetical protein